MAQGVIFDIKKYAIHDGPGIRTTVFFKGCPLSCWWCHNPEGLTPAEQHTHCKDRCIACGDCIKICPQKAIAPANNGFLLDETKCIRCRACAKACPADAHVFIGQTVTVEAVVEQIIKDMVFYDQSKGGVTFSGGEPLMQPDFLLALLDACGQLDLHRTVDTTGHTDAETLLKVAERTELFLYDLKHMDPEKHRNHTGVSNERILGNLGLLARIGARICVRIPLIAGMNDDDKNIRQTADFVCALPGVKQVSLLPFHGSAKGKYARLGTACFWSEMAVPSARDVAAIAERLESFGLQVKIGG